MNNIIQFPEQRNNFMLLSYRKYATASTYKSKHEPCCAVDENQSTCWSSASGSAGEWFQIDLGTLKSVHAVQINGSLSARCKLYGSADGKSFTLLSEGAVGESKFNGLIVFEGGKKLRFLRLEFLSNASDCFSLSSFRVFGFGNGSVPKKVENPFAFKSSSTKATVCWNKVSTAVGYNVRFGSDPNQLYNSISVYNADSFSFNFLTNEMCYYAVDAFNENGVTKGDINVINTVAANKKICRVH